MIEHQLADSPCSEVVRVSVACLYRSQQIMFCVAYTTCAVLLSCLPSASLSAVRLLLYACDGGLNASVPMPPANYLST